jgi:hypothetical protein
MRPSLDVVDVITDPDFCDTDLSFQRFDETVNDQGRAVLSPTTFGFAGVITNDKGALLQRGIDAERIKDTILIVTRTKLRAAGVNVSADIVTSDGKPYTVTQILGYSRYGRGFVEVIAELLPLAG